MPRSRSYLVLNCCGGGVDAVVCEENEGLRSRSYRVFRGCGSDSDGDVSVNNGALTRADVLATCVSPPSHLCVRRNPQEGSGNETEHLGRRKRPWGAMQAVHSRKSGVRGKSINRYLNSQYMRAYWIA